MTLHRKCAIFLVTLCTMRCVIGGSGSDIRDNDVSGDSNEDDKLKQALVLVDLLKNEYVKTLRENYHLRKGTRTEEPTCATDERSYSTSTSQSAPTTEGAPTAAPVDAPVNMNALPPVVPVNGRRMGGVTPHPLQLFTGQSGAFQPDKFARRRIPVAYYYGGYDYPFRRRDFRRQDDDLSDTTETTALTITQNVTENATENSITNTETETTIENSTTNTETETVVENSTANTETETEAVNPTEQEEATNTLDTTASPDATESFEATNTADLVQSQVDFELIQELKVTKNLATTKKIRFLKHKAVTANKYLRLIKPTMKIHLGRSTPYPIPLPENHAFCYTNPNNPLCRTAI